MMDTHFGKTVRFLVSIAFISTTTPLYAVTSQQAAETYTEYALSLQQEGDVLGAVSEFSQALILNPDNTRAQYSLIALADTAQVPSEKKINLFQVEDLITYNKDLKEKIDYFEGKLDNLAMELIHNNYDTVTLQRELDRVKREVVVNIDDSEISKDTSTLKNSLDAYRMNLMVEKFQLETKFEVVQRQFEKIRDIHRARGLSRGEMAQPPMPDQLDPPIQFYTDSGERLPLPQSLSIEAKGDTLIYTKEEIDLFKKKISQVRNQLTDLQRLGESKDKKTQEIKEELIAAHLNLNEKDAILKERTYYLELLRQDYTDLEARVNLGKTIILGNEKEIAVTKQKLVDLRAASDQKISEKNNRIEQLTQNLAEIKDQAGSFQKDFEIASDVLTKVKAKLDSTTKDLDAKDVELNGLKSTLADYQTKFRSTEETLALAQKKLEDVNVGFSQMNVQLNDYRTQLSAKDQELAKLEEKYQKSQNQLTESKNELAKKDEKIAGMNSSLMGVQKELIAIHDSVQAKEKDFENTLSARNQDLSDFAAELERTQNKLIETLGELVKKDQEIAAINDAFLVTKKELVSTKAAVQEKEMERISQASKTDQSGAELAELEGILAGYRDQLADLNSKLSAKNETMTAKEMLIIEKDAIILTQEQDIAQLQEELKNNQGELAKAKSRRAKQIVVDLEEKIGVQSEKILKLSAQTKQFRTSLQNAQKEIQRKDYTIGELKQELEGIALSKGSNSRKYREQANTIKMLKDALARDREMKELRNVKLREVVRDKTTEIDELNGILEIYKEKLSTANSQSRGNSTLVRELQDKLSSVENQLSDKDQVLQKTRDNLKILKTQLATIQEKIVQLEKDRAEQVEISPESADEISDLKSRLNDINYFLKKELKDFDIMSGNLNP